MVADKEKVDIVKIIADVITNPRAIDALENRSLRVDYKAFADFCIDLTGHAPVDIITDWTDKKADGD